MNLNVTEKNVFPESKQEIISIVQVQQKVRLEEARNNEYLRNHKNKFMNTIRSFFKYYLNICLTERDKEMFSTYDIAKKFLTGKLDLTYYLKMIDHMNRLKSLLLKPYQIFMLDHQKKVNLLSPHEKLELEILDNEIISSDNDIQMNLLQIITKKIKEKSFDDIDNALYENLDMRIKKLIDKIFIV
jgi:hypothetical protein